MMFSGETYASNVALTNMSYFACWCVMEFAMISEGANASVIAPSHSPGFGFTPNVTT